MNVLVLGILVGSIPTIAMLSASLLLYRYSLDKISEAVVQNFAGGLILAAVASELFPLMTDGYSKVEIWAGVTIGFACAVVVLNGVEHFVEHMVSDDRPGLFVSNPFVKEITPIPDEIELAHHSKETEDKEELLDNDMPSSSQADVDNAIEPWDHHSVAQATYAINIPVHREHILSHFTEILDIMHTMEGEAKKLMEGNVVEVVAEEKLAESVDEALHLVQYKLDHSRRLLQGSEYESPHDASWSEYRRTWLTDDKKKAILHGVLSMETSANHLYDHLKAPKVDFDTVKEIDSHMHDMDRHIVKFHELLDTWTWKWKRHDMAETVVGDSIRTSLVIPVIIDCFVDGFLIGVSVSLSHKAGFILATANCLEMCSLGIAYSSRIAKCTGSSASMRQAAVVIPPLIMLLATVVGVLMADFAEGVGVLYVSFVSFGVYALTSLVCCELLIEAHEVQEEEGKNWIQFALFFGIYVVIMIAPVF